MKQELNIEVDEDNNVIGLRPREDFYGTGRIHRGVHLLLFNSDSKLLLQRRSENKKWYPRFFSFSAGGTVGDETTEECIKRETYEEIGIKDISFNELFTFHFSDKVNNSFETIFLSQSDSPVIIDKKEVESCKWVSIEELKKDLLKNSDIFTPPFLEAIKIYFEKFPLYDKVVEYVDKSFGKKKPHFERTVYWIEKFIPNATEAHRISAYAHDIERGVKGENERDYLNPEILKRHSEEGAEILGEFLQKNRADTETINKVKHLISRHEVGGDMEQNALMDADSVSYFETNAQKFVEKRVPVEGYKNIKEKFDWMFNRISTEEHKKFARENYEKWSKELEKYK